LNYQPPSPIPVKKLNSPTRLLASLTGGVTVAPQSRLFPNFIAILINMTGRKFMSWSANLSPTRFSAIY